MKKIVNNGSLILILIGVISYALGLILRVEHEKHANIFLDISVGAGLLGGIVFFLNRFWQR